MEGGFSCGSSHVCAGPSTSSVVRGDRTRRRARRTRLVWDPGGRDGRNRAFSRCGRARTGRRRPQRRRPLGLGHSHDRPVFWRPFPHQRVAWAGVRLTKPVPTSHAGDSRRWSPDGGPRCSSLTRGLALPSEAVRHVETVKHLEQPPPASQPSMPPSVASIAGLASASSRQRSRTGSTAPACSRVGHPRQGRKTPGCQLGRG